MTKSSALKLASKTLKLMLRDSERRADADILADIELYGIENFYAHPSAIDYAPTLPEPELHVQYNLLKRVDPHHGYSQSEVGRPSQWVEYGASRYTATSLRYLRALALLKQHSDYEGVNDLLQLGGGFGLLGDIFLKQSPSHFYVNVDHPPLAAIATYYLTELYGEEGVLNYTRSRKMKRIDLAQLRHHYRAVVLCPWQLPRVTGWVDLAVSFATPAEFAPHLDDVKRLCRGPILLGPGEWHEDHFHALRPWSLKASEKDNALILTPPNV